jgi:hypothetical protein
MKPGCCIINPIKIPKHVTPRLASIRGGSNIHALRERQKNADVVEQQEVLEQVGLQTL